MKRSIAAIILYFLVIHVALPGLYYLFYGFFPVYSSLVDMPALLKGFLLITISLILSLGVLFVLPSKDIEVKPNINGKPVTELFYFSVILKLLVFYYYGGFSGLISGNSNGTLGNYISLFFNPFILLLILFFVQKKKSSLILAVFFYVLSVTLSGSRSGILTIVFVFLIGYSFVNFQHYKRSLRNFLFYGLLVTPLIFVFATNLRGYTDDIDMTMLMNQIAGRMSVLETSMLPIHFYDQHLDMSLFYEKYSFWNQFKLAIDSIIPGQLFSFDVMPNNYYRAMFMGYSKAFVVDNYMSVNFTLPVYLYLKYSYLAIPFTVLYISGTYYLIRFFKDLPLVVVLLLSVFYNVIYYFDWVMVFSVLYKSLLTILLMKLYIFCRTGLKIGLKNFEYAN